MKQYDYIVVGGGPSGLAFVQTISKTLNKKILVIEADSILGGCHTVERRNGFFLEHGPRIYSNRFKSFNNLLIDMNSCFDELFAKTSGNSFTLYSKFAKKFKWYEIIAFILIFIIILIIPNYGKCKSVLQFCKEWKFSSDSIDLINQLCKGSDGADIQKYSLNTFISLITQHLGYSFYHPKYPNDISLFKLWEKTLLKRDVDIVYNSRINTINDNKLTSIDGNVYNGKKIIFAIPPVQLQTILQKSKLSTFKDSFLKETRYIKYLSITFHWNEKFKLSTENGIATGTQWDLVYAPISEYTNFQKSKTILSIAITSFHKKGNLYDKLPDNCTLDELFNEIYFQLDPIFKFPKIPTNVFKTNLDRPAFVKTSNSNFIPFKMNNGNFYTLGTHNGKSNYPFTTIESAVQNGISLANEIIPETRRYNFKDNTILGFNFIRLLCLLCLLFYFVYAQSGNTFNM